MTSGNNDPEEWREIIGNKHHKDELAKKFKDNDSPMKIAIVVDMWLTGFDVPSLATMYVYKPMSGHNLMQAIARVNRVFRDKEGGLVVDYVGIASALKQAMNDYTTRDKKNYGDTDVAKVAYPKFVEKLSICRDMFHGYDYSKFMKGTDIVIVRCNICQSFHYSLTTRMFPFANILPFYFSCMDISFSVGIIHIIRGNNAFTNNFVHTFFSEHNIANFNFVCKLP